MAEKFGWVKDKFDPRDYLRKATYKTIPPVVVLEDYLPEIRNQGSVGSCVGFGIGANLVARAKRLENYIEWFSPTWIYNGARFIEGTLTQDIGCYPRDALHWLYQKGCLLESFWPYDPTKLDKTPPPSSLEPEAAKNPLLSYYRIVDGVDGICEAIADGYYVSIGTPWPHCWLDPGETGQLPEIDVNSWIVGGHETCLYGYDKTTLMFYGINSWGKDWGNKGKYIMPFSALEVFKKKGGYDVHFIGLTVAPEPEENGCSLARAYAGVGNFLARSLGRSSRLKVIANE